MRKIVGTALLCSWALGAGLGVGPSVHANTGGPAMVGQTAPPFTARDTAGRAVSLADFKGRTVVLEWVNPGCPYVQKHYRSGNMQGTQREAAAKGVVWLAVNSTSSDHSDYLPPAALADWMKTQQAAASATLMDADGRIGRAYGARTTPHMYVIDARGQLVYAGAIDSRPTANPSDIAGATNHVKAALAEALAGKPVSVAQTRAYGCSVKYPSGA
jgi:peroxiredoxin